MKSRISFLGTGGDAVTVGKQILRSGGILLESGNSQFHIDPGPGSLLQLKLNKINVREHTAVFVTHNHTNHCNDLNAIIGAMTHGGMDPRGVIVANKSVVEGTTEMSPTLSKFHAKCVEKVIQMEPGQRIGINDIDIIASYARHSDPHALGFRFYTPNFTLSYISDTNYTPDIFEHHKQPDILIMNVTNPGKVKVKGQLNTEDAVKVIRKLSPKLAIITHFGVKMLEADPIHEARYIQKQTAIQTIAAKDGMQINPVSYSANMRQKSLKSYKG